MARARAVDRRLFLLLEIAARRMNREADARLKDEAGVTAASPAIEPVAAPSTLGLPNFTHSIAIHVIVATDAEMWVTTSAIAAPPFAPSALPALKPNQPTQSMAVPMNVIVRLCGGIGVLP